MNHLIHLFLLIAAVAVVASLAIGVQLYTKPPTHWDDDDD